MLKVTLLFQAGDQEGGWSEVYWMAGSGITAGTGFVDVYAPIRASILSPDNQILGARISSPLLPPTPGYLRSQRAAYLYVKNVPGAFPAVVATESDLVYSALQIRWNNADKTVFKNQMFRGMPYTLWAGSGAIGRGVANSFIMTVVPIFTLYGVQINHKVRPNQPVPPSPAIASGEFVRFSHHNTGRAFGTLRGRR